MCHKRLVKIKKALNLLSGKHEWIEKVFSDWQQHVIPENISLKTSVRYLLKQVTQTHLPQRRDNYTDSETGMGWKMYKLLKKLHLPMRNLLSGFWQSWKSWLRRKDTQPKKSSIGVNSGFLKENAQENFHSWGCEQAIGQTQKLGLTVLLQVQHSWCNRPEHWDATVSATRERPIWAPVTGVVNNTDKSVA